MNLNDVRDEINAISTMLGDMIAAEEISSEFALELTKVLLHSVLCRNSVNTEYVPDP